MIGKMIKSKDELRKELLNSRNNIPKKEIRLKSGAIQQKVIESEDYRCASTILLYYSKENEVNTAELIGKSLEKKNVLLPVVDKESKSLLLVKLDDLNSLKKGAFGIMEPVINKDKSNIVSPTCIDLAIIPAVGIDLNGNRIGYGTGYYDKLFSINKNSAEKKFNKIALVFDSQLIESIPPDSGDVKVNGVVTEKRTLKWI